MPPSRSGCLSPGLLLPSSPGPFHTSSPRQQPEEAVRSGHAGSRTFIPPSFLSSPPQPCCPFPISTRHRHQPALLQEPAEARSGAWGFPATAQLHCLPPVSQEFRILYYSVFIPTGTVSLCLFLKDAEGLHPLVFVRLAVTLQQETLLSVKKLSLTLLPV